MTLLAAAAALLAVAGWTGEAAANAALCRKLESQLASAGKPNAGQARRYDKAIRDQKTQIQNVRAQLGDMGCGFFSMRDECGAAKSTLRRMEGNLSELERTRAEMDGSGSKREQARILAAIRENGCRDGGQVASRGIPADRRSPSLFERLFGRSANNEIRQDSDTFSDPSERGSRAAGGSFRTLCVRTCDGYYFPISYSSTRADFDRDAKACAAMCPGTETVLFHHRVPSQESEEMVSAATGMPYADLPHAFDYRKPGFVRGPACGCGAPKEFSIVAGNTVENVSGDTVEIAPPTPLARPDMAEDPETARNRSGGLDLAALRRLMAEPEPEPTPVASITPSPEAREVRVVGPAFLPDPEGAIDLRAPGRPQIQ